MSTPVWFLNEIPITDNPDQKINVTLRDTKAVMHLKYNAYFDNWVFDLFIDSKRVIAGRNMVLDYDMLQGYNLGVGSLLLTNLPSVREKSEPNRVNLTNGDVRMVALWQGASDV